MNQSRNETIMLVFESW